MRKEKTWKQIEMDRNRRLTITQIIVPLATAIGGLFAASPELRQNVARKVEYKKHEFKVFKEKKLREFRGWKENRKKEKALKTVAKEDALDVKSRTKIFTMLNDIEMHCDDDWVMAKINNIRKELNGED